MKLNETIGLWKMKHSNSDYDSEILSNNYHTTSLLVDDIKHLVSDGESLTIISEQYGISVNNLRIYNNLDSDIIFPGQIIKIPNRYDTELMINTTTVENEVDIYQYYKGIDVSEFQGEIDWELARTKIDFAIIRIADAYNRDSDGNIMIDERFRYNIEECNRLGIPVGVYIYTRADNEEELNEELRFVLENIEPYNITLPIYRDLEGSRAEQLITSESDRLNQVALTDRFCSTIEQAGYPSGIYLHKKYLGYIPELGNKYSIWAQGGWCYSTECDFDDMQYALEEDGNGGLVPFDLTYAVNIFQSTEQGLAHELGIQSNYVDFNYVDQEFVNNLIKKFDKDGNVYVLKRN